MTPEHDPLVDLAAAVADGSSVDWDVAQSSAGSAQDADAIGQLHILAEIARLHREAGSGSAAAWLSVSASPDTPAAPAASHDDAPPWGPLRVLERLGSGAFGDVYRAWDTSLDREVALKLLRKRARGASADLIAREGQLLARIHHANVMSIYGAQIIDGQVGIWGEFLRGRTLAQMVADNGPLSAEETLVFADAICRALAAAHRAGLLHRDVKAQNVIREKGGRIVLMDFGLGRELQTDDATEFELAGTPLYLAPELLTGSRASVHSDIYSLGVLLFFLVTGTFPVTGKKLEEIAANHASGQRQRLSDLRPDLPTSFIHVVERALEPDPARRFESAGAMQAAVSAASQPLRTTDVRQPGPTAAGRSMLAASVAAVAALGLAVWFLAPRPRSDNGWLSFSLESPPGTHFPDSSRNAPAISPDGRMVALAAADGSGAIRLWLHSLESGERHVIEDSVGAMTPFWAPDSRAVAFFEPSGAVRTVSIEPGAAPSSPRNTAQEPRGGAWNSDGILLLSKGPRGGLYRGSAAGDASQEALVIAPDARGGELGYMWPQFLPDGKRFIYFNFSNDAKVRGIYLSSLDGGPRRQLVRSDTSGVLAGDSVLFVQGGNLVAQSFRWSSGEARGSPQTIATGVASTYDYQTVASVSDDQTLVYLPAVETTELVWFDRRGQELDKVPLPAARYRSPALSRDGRFLAVQRYRDSLSEIAVFDLVQRQFKSPLAHSADVQFPVWGPGHQLVYASIDQQKQDVYIRDFDTDDDSRVLFSGGATDDSDKMPTDWSTDGQFLTFVSLPRGGAYSLWTLPFANPAAAQPVRPAEGTQVSGRISPDGEWVAYTRRVPLRRVGGVPEREVWVSRFPSGTSPRMIASGGMDLAWPSHQELSFFDAADTFTLARLPPASSGAIEVVARFTPGVRTPLASRNNYAWTADGSRVLFNRPILNQTAIRLQVRVPRKAQSD